MRHACTILAAALLLGGGAFAAPAPLAGGLIAAWNRDDGLGGITIQSCGDVICGHIAWLKEPRGPGHVGEQVLFDMRETAPNTWTGTAHNPEDEQDYAGTLILEGDHLFTKGCVFGGLICKSVTWTRAP